jgi:hypothetical protein
MNLLKTYIREQVKAFVLEAQANGVRLPEVPTGARAGAVGQDTNVTEQARRQFVQTAISWLTQYNGYVTGKQQFDATNPTDITIAKNIHDALKQISEQINKDTINWTDVPTGINLDALKPQDSESALRKVLEATKWARSPDNSEIDPLAINNIRTNLPLIISALTSYMNS